MSEDKNVVEDGNNDALEQETIDYKAEYERTKTEYEKTKKENSDFFNDMKKYKNQVKEYEEKLNLTSKNAEESKSYKERFESLDKQMKEREQQWQEKQASYDSEKLRNKALKLANELNPLDADAADMLADYLHKRLKMTEDGIRILDKDGKESNLKDEDLKEEFKAVERYKRLLRGRDSSGSGASGSGKVGGTNKLDHYAKMKPMDRLTALRESKHIE